MSEKFINHSDTLQKTTSGVKSFKNGAAYGIIIAATAFTVGILLLILGFIFVNGVGHLNLDFFIEDFDAETAYVTTHTVDLEADSSFTNKLGVVIGEVETEEGVFYGVTEIQEGSHVDDSILTLKTEESFPMEEGDAIREINGIKIEPETMVIGAMEAIVNESAGGNVKLEVQYPDDMSIVTLDVPAADESAFEAIYNQLGIDFGPIETEEGTMIGITYIHQRANSVRAKTTDGEVYPLAVGDMVIGSGSESIDPKTATVEEMNAFIDGLSGLRIPLNIYRPSTGETVSLESPKASAALTNALGIRFAEIQAGEGHYYEIAEIYNGSNGELAVDENGNSVPLEKGMYVLSINDNPVEGDVVVIKGIEQTLNTQAGDTMDLKIVRPGGGALPMIITTIEMILLSLLIACPIGIFAAIYLVEYAKEGRLVRIIRFATESLSGIPSIIYGLFGMLVFVIYFKFDYSLISGALTVSIILLPIIVRQTEESLKAVPMSYREGSLGLGATKLQTIRKAVLPSAVPGIAVAVILSIGRIIGESAALLLTAGTTARVATLFSSGATLTVKAYQVAKEEADIKMACALGTIIIIIVIVLNALSRLISKKYSLNK